MYLSIHCTEYSFADWHDTTRVIGSRLATVPSLHAMLAGTSGRRMLRVRNQFSTVWEGGLTNLSVQERAAEQTAMGRGLSLYLASLSEFHDRGSHPQICCDHEAPSPARRGETGGRVGTLSPHPRRPLVTPSPRYYCRPCLVCPWRAFEGRTCRRRPGQDKPGFAGLRACGLDSCRQAPRFLAAGLVVYTTW